MNLHDLLHKPVNELSDEELEQRLALQKKLNVRFGKSPQSEVKVDSSGNVVTVTKKKPKVKTNADRQLEDLLKNLSPDQLQQVLVTLVKEAKNNG